MSPRWPKLDRTTKRTATSIPVLGVAPGAAPWCKISFDRDARVCVPLFFPASVLMSDDLDRLLSDALADRSERHLLRSRRILRPIDATHVESDTVRLINFASNDYLGLTHHPQVIESVRTAVGEGTGSGAAGLISGYTRRHATAEQAIARWKGTEAAVLLPSGYQANLAAVQTLAGVAEQQGRPVWFLIDKLAHASLIDAVRATDAPFRVFPHNGLTKLRRLLEQSEPPSLQVVVTESIFSMDGDAVDLAGLGELKLRHPFTLLLDEAHASGVYGRRGAGLAAELGLAALVDVSVATLSKALGGIGGAVCGSERFCQALVNFGRAYIFSTSVPPYVPAAVEAAIGVLREEPQRQARVRSLARHVRATLSDACEIPPGDSPIVPVVLGDEHRTLQAADALRQRGLLVVAVRPPTVPRGASRLRVTLSCEHTDEEVELLVEAIRAITGPAK